MPSSFTAPLYEGEQTFHDFVLRCARGMSPTIMLRDLELERRPTPVNVKSGDAYERRALAEAREWLKRSKAMSDAEAESLAGERFRVAMEEWERSSAVTRARRRRFEDMIKDVERWETPPILDSLKKFMIDQLTETMRYDCRTYEKPRRLSAQEIRESEIEMATRMVEMNAKRIVEIGERDRERSDWVRALYDSLKFPIPDSWREA